MTSTTSKLPVTKFKNCRILVNHKIIREDLWVRDGKIINPEKLFYSEKGHADKEVDCGNCIISPGYIDTQINGGFGVDFSSDAHKVKDGLLLVARNILSHGVTSYCPTVITSTPETYKEIIPEIKKQEGGPHGASVLGIHLEGPFISEEKKGAHPIDLIKTYEDNGFKEVMDTYSTLENVAIITLAPEFGNADVVIEELTRKGVVVSLGHSEANLEEAEEAVQHGARFITHLFNAMGPFHHRDPGIVGLLTSDNIPSDQEIFYGMIADGIHTNPAALRIAHRSHPDGMVLVTDAMAAMGLPSGRHQLGSVAVDVVHRRASVAGTTTLSGSIATMDDCVRHFKEATRCTTEQALEAATLHPAQMLRITDRKGTLEYDTDADFIFLDDDLSVSYTYIAGELVWDNSKDKIEVVQRSEDEEEIEYARDV
ncbi:N-acetylglucosamine-6-phosphate deacetylase-like [Amphiura filiformis]|uniref:N-acetylglucosamine-6-phosphate deacetylase-like n=1 Tax=Amphiura filiformis TaxID=82378 RepID=UPI003B21FD84